MKGCLKMACPWTNQLKLFFSGISIWSSRTLPRTSGTLVTRILRTQLGWSRLNGWRKAFPVWQREKNEWVSGTQAVLQVRWLSEIRTTLCNKFFTPGKRVFAFSSGFTIAIEEIHAFCGFGAIWGG